MEGKQKKLRSMRVMNMHIPSHILMIIWCVVAPVSSIC